MSAPAFFEIGCRSNFSFLEGASHPEEMVATAARIGIAGLGLADRNTVAGVVRMHAVARVKGYAFRPGARLVFADGTPELAAYPVNRRGWGNLCRMLSAGNLRSDKGVCTLYESDLVEWAADLMVAAMVPSFATEAQIEDYCARLARLVPPLDDRLYLALIPRYDGLDRLAFRRIEEMARRFALPLIASNDPFYHEPARKPLADVVTAIRAHVTVADAGFRLHAHAERHLKEPGEMARLFRSHPQAITATVEFFSRLNFSLDELSHQYPDEVIDGETSERALRRLTYEGAAQRFPNGIPQKIADLLEYELNLIGEKRYEPYFLTVHRIIGFARSEGILCQGRGSAANSAVCYCLGITEVNPEKTTLLFDRFISTERDEPPDIDVDFEHARRDEVIRFIYRTYGREHAALTAAVINYRARSAGREAAKVFGLSEDVQTALSGSIWGWSTADLSEREAKAAGLDLADPTTRRVLDYASTLMGFPRHLSQHVGGFVITRDRLDEVVPIMNTADGRYMVEWNKDDLDTLKILKIDVLALGMLTCLAKAIKLLADHYGKRMTLASFFEDHRPEVYDMICRADTLGVFQIESRAQMSMLPRLKPREFYDLVIEVAIVRPGPIQGNMVHPYLKNRKEKEEGRVIDYPKPELEAVLKRTLGVPLFQEQAMQIAITAAGFTPAEADQLRRAMATFRRTGQVADFRQRFLDGMLQRDYTREFAERCFSQIEGFGEYGFPESHAASFALLVYASAWIKAFYPDVFCAALLNSQPMGFYAPAQLVRDAREHGVEVRPVDVNASAWNSDLEKSGFDARRLSARHASMRKVILSARALRLGFRQVKGLSEADMGLLVARRGRGYVSVRDLWMRTGLSRAVIERLADADAFASLGLSRREALWAAQALDHQAAVEHLPLFSEVRGGEVQAEAKVDLPMMPLGEQVIHDYRVLSLSLKAHPLSFLRDEFASAGILTSSALEDEANGRRVDVAGLVLVRQRPGSARGVIFMTLEDETGVANVIIWPKIFERYRSIVMGARLVRVRGRLQKADGVIHVVAERVVDASGKLSLLREALKDFSGLANAGEAHCPLNERRDDGKSSGSLAQLIRDAPDLAGEVGQVMPKGRNFH
ncbi:MULTISPECIES: error-prone DNA polymerase [Alphaproteobacteria]|uniref:Error-prone DNA polymerase n=2 Tax=Alphaproteobacteria TaxID=28211 RepID=A0A512HK42_9HYPH|nr:MULTISPECIES: error-prone DNA polymerase [Alphaproteobacteria]GEO85816.1 error-prone DNA polymerase 1 [Ciceribacter naphthalenivorans]GLR21672.1 error-prone DNA polymerase 1 [Ciceribacter naphthalenivorans]GLT04528.1 error-prone DNA polymerase 1 [Sphingomonas psychrolutea]